MTAMRLLLLLIAGAIGACSQAKQPHGFSVPANAAAESTAYLENLREEARIAGLAAAVAVDGEIVWSGGFGLADAEAGIAVTPDTVFRIGSVSKVLTAAALARMVDTREIALDVPVAELVPEYGTKGEALTPRLLAAHLGGVRHYRYDEEEDKRAYDDVVDALEVFADDPLVRAPGSGEVYSSYGFVLLSAAMQRAADEAFPDLMRQYVFAPLGMKDTQPDGRDKRSLPGRTRHYDGAEPAEDIDISYKWAGGGFLSTAEDLARFGSAFLPGSDFLSAQTAATMFTRQRDAGGIETSYGLGWVVDAFDDGSPVYYHGGTVLGGHAHLSVEPRTGVVVAILANRESNFGLEQGLRLSCLFKPRTPCELPVAVREENAKIGVAIGAIQRTFPAFLEALGQGDLETVGTFIDERFHSAQWSSKNDLLGFAEAAFQQGGIETGGDLDIGIRGVEAGDFTFVRGVEFSHGFETGTTLVFRFDGEDWRLIGTE